MHAQCLLVKIRKISQNKLVESMQYCTVYTKMALKSYDKN